MYVLSKCGYAWSTSLGQIAHFDWRASSHRRLVHVRRDILLHNMRPRWRSLLLGQCTTVEPCMPTPKSRSTKVTCPHWYPELSIKSESRSSTMAMQKTCQVLQAKISSNGTQLSAYGSWGQPSILLSSHLSFEYYHSTAVLLIYGRATTPSGPPSLPLIMPATLPDFHPNYGFLLLSPINIKPWLWRLSTRVMTISLWWHASFFPLSQQFAWLFVFGQGSLWAIH